MGNGMYTLKISCFPDVQSSTLADAIAKANEYTTRYGCIVYIYDGEGKLVYQCGITLC